MSFAQRVAIKSLTTENLDYRGLQKLAKKLGLKANGNTTTLKKRIEDHLKNQKTSVEQSKQDVSKKKENNMAKILSEIHSKYILNKSEEEIATTLKEMSGSCRRLLDKIRSMRDNLVIRLNVLMSEALAYWPPISELRKQKLVSVPPPNVHLIKQFLRYEKKAKAWGDRANEPVKAFLSDVNNDIVVTIMEMVTVIDYFEKLIPKYKEQLQKREESFYRESERLIDSKIDASNEGSCVIV
tara:strand:- start:6 stop:725 length:720 start_codon:yes stop_codon:yes gene_type:complete